MFWACLVFINSSKIVEIGYAFHGVTLVLGCWRHRPSESLGGTSQSKRVVYTLRNLNAMHVEIADIQPDAYHG
jgi:hypothetical protein